MENNKQYSTTWVQENEMPQIGVKCPKCPDGYLKDSQYGGVWCPECKWKWRVSKYPPKYPSKSGAENKPVATTESPRDIILLDEIKAINKRITDLGLYLVKKLGKEDDE